LPLPAALAQSTTQGQRTLLVHVGGRLPSKRWPLEFHRLLLEQFLQQAPNWRALLLGGPEDDLSGWSGPGDVLPTPPSLSHLLRWLAAADLVLANDSLPAHLAAALARPCLALFGSGDPAWFTPGGDHTNAISTTICPFRPCLDQCRQPSLLCLESLTPDLVLPHLLKKSQPDSPHLQLD
jgi:ADP-heptose:LPS heptosyltransferase